MTKNIVLFGCPRSGTSLFLELLAELGWNAYFEPGMNFVTDSLLRESRNRNKAWAVKNPIDVAGYRDPGLTCRLRDLHNTVGSDYQLLWVVRHPLDTICSLRKGLANWQHQPIPPGYLRMSDRQVDQRGVGVWKWVNSTGWETAEMAGLKPEILRYEDLLNKPRELIATITELTDAQTPSQMQVDRFVRRLSKQPGVHEAAYQSRWSTRTHSAHMGRWRENMNILQLTYALRELGDLPAKFGYSLPSLAEPAAVWPRPAVTGAGN